MVIGLLGFGTVGRGFYEILSSRSDMKIKYILGRRKYAGVENLCTQDMEKILSDPEVDTVVELIGGLHPAYEYIRASIGAGKNVVTANKLLISRYYEELVRYAEASGVSLRYSAAVGGGVPWLPSLERAHRISRVYEVYGILNGTTNFILDAMQEKKLSFDKVLCEAQRLGYAEKDPSADIDGLDAQRKIAISANVAFGVILDEKKVNVLGIRHIRQSDLSAAAEKGMICRLIGRAKRFGEKVGVWVEPEFLPASAPECAVHSCYNLITFDCQYAGRESFYGAGAGRLPTGYSVAHDCLDVQSQKAGLYNWQMLPAEPDNGLEKHAYYVRTVAPSPSLEKITASPWGEGILTKKISVPEMHGIINEIISSGAEVFAAGIQE